MDDKLLREILEGEPDYHRRRHLIEDNYRVYLESYPHQWVALTEGDVLVVASSMEALLQQMDSQGLPRISAVIRYLDPNPPKVKITPLLRFPLNHNTGS